jgi:hypothetical protein
MEGSERDEWNDLRKTGKKQQKRINKKIKRMNITENIYVTSAQE